MQTLHHYTKALALGQKALETPLIPAKPLPHIFGSAAYIQDQYAGLGSLQPENSSNDQPGIDSVSTADSIHLPSNHPAFSTHKLYEPIDPVYQPQNLKTMLEAALKGDLTSHPGSVAETKQYRHEGPAASSQDASTAESDGHQPGGAVDASADLPHVLAWLEQGRGLFDDDEHDDLSLAKS